MKKAQKKAKKKSKRSGEVSGKLMTGEQRALHRKRIDAEMLLSNAQHNYKVAHGYVGDFFTKSEVEKKYGAELKRSERRLERLQRKLDEVNAKIVVKLTSGAHQEVRKGP